MGDWQTLTGWILGLLVLHLVSQWWKNRKR